MGSPLIRLADLLPARCAVCGGWPTTPVCAACSAAFRPATTRCRQCAAPVSTGVDHCGRCVLVPPPLEATVAAVDYTWPWSMLVQRFKYGGEPGLAGPLATLMRTGVGAADLLEHAELVLPMPLARSRLRERGYNQSLLLARALAPRQRLAATLLWRVRDTAPQEGLTREQRHANVAGAFAVDPLQVAALRGRRVLLVDDVLTSGASVFEAARCLRAGGAASVTALVFARTPLASND